MTEAQVLLLVGMVGALGVVIAHFISRLAEARHKRRAFFHERLLDAFCLFSQFAFESTTLWLLFAEASDDPAFRNAAYQRFSLAKSKAFAHGHVLTALAQADRGICAGVEESLEGLNRLDLKRNWQDESKLVCLRVDSVNQALGRQFEEYSGFLAVSKAPEVPADSKPCFEDRLVGMCQRAFRGYYAKKARRSCPPSPPTARTEASNPAAESSAPGTPLATPGA